MRLLLPRFISVEIAVQYWPVGCKVKGNLSDRVFRFDLFIGLLLKK
jgi:hypothetical protein